MKVYLDTCSLHRPLDSKTQIRIVLESEAVLGIIGLCEAGQLELVSSDVLVFEVNRNPQIIRREFGLEVLAKASSFVALNQQIEQRARELNKLGIKPLDALHLASAEEIRVDYFCTCDDKFLKKAKAVSDVKIKVVSPLELIEEIE
jgi:predicted nucleic acid-binding protein